MLSHFSIGNYRAYRETQTFHFCKPGEGRLGLNILVGQNNAGKSTPLSLIRDLFAQNEDLVFDSQSTYPDADPFVELGFCFDGREERLHCIKRDRSFFVKKIDGLNDSESRRHQIRQRIKFVPSRRSWSDRFSRQNRQNISQHEEQLYNTPRNQEAQLGSILADIIRADRKGEYDSILKRVLPEIVDWHIDSFMDQDYIVYRNASGRVHALGLLGDGFASVFRLAFTLFSSAPGSVVVLDEPELSLHPEAQKSLYSLLSELSSDRQIIIATHSPYMVSWPDLARGARLFRLSLSAEGHCRVSALEEPAIAAVLPVVQTDIRNRRLFDVLAKEAFFRRSVVFCEGQEDVHYIENYVQVRGLPSLPLFAYGSGGASVIDAWLSLASNLNIRSAAIFDGNEKQEADRVALKYRERESVRVFHLPANDIRDKPDKGIRGVFNSRGQVNEEFVGSFEAMLADLFQWLQQA